MNYEMRPRISVIDILREHLLFATNLSDRETNNWISKSMSTKTIFPKRKANLVHELCIEIYSNESGRRIHIVNDDKGADVSR